MLKYKKGATMNKYNKNLITASVASGVLLALAATVFVLIEPTQGIGIASSAMIFFVAIAAGILSYFALQSSYAKKGWDEKTIQNIKAPLFKLAVSGAFFVASHIIIFASLGQSGSLFRLIYVVVFACFAFLAIKNVWCIRKIKINQMVAKTNKWQKVTLVAGILMIAVFVVVGIVFKGWGNNGLLFLILCALGIILSAISLW